MNTSDVNIYVAAHRDSPPTLPLREELIQVGIECVYQPNDKSSDSIQELNRKRLMVKRLLQSTQERSRLKCSKAQTVRTPITSDLVGATLEHDASDNSTANSTLTMLDTKGNDSIRSKYIWQPELIKENSVPVVNTNMGITLPPLLPDRSEDIDDMTKDTYILAGISHTERAFKPPQVIFTKGKENEEDMRWYEENCVHNSSGVGIVEDFEEGDILDDGAKGTVNTVVKKEIIVQRYTDDMSTLADSTCGYFYSSPDIVVNESHDLALKVQHDDDLKLVNQVVSGCDNDGNGGITRKIPLDDNHHHITKISMSSQIDYLFHMLNDTLVKPEDVQNILDKNPQTTRIARESDKKLALHILCDRQFICRRLLSNDYNKESRRQMDQQPRPSEEDNYVVHTMITNLIEEIIKKRVMLKVVAWSNIDACRTLDKNGDLPVHLLARKLQKWTSDIQQFIRCHIMDVSDFARITTISKTVSECIDIVLRPVALNGHSISGSIGVMLPIHISIMFWCDFDTFRLLLERTSSGASVPYISDNTMSAEHMLPLEILEKMRYDQEQYKKIMNDGNEDCDTGHQWKFSTSIPDNFCAQDFTRRSDQLFLLHPDILPYRKENIRLRRIESLIRSEAMLSDRGISTEVQNVWTWMCTYNNRRNVYDKYDQNIHNIVDDLLPVHLSKLINVMTKTRRPLLQEATNSIREILVQSSEHSKENQSSVQYQSGNNQGASKKENTWNEFKYLPGIATMCNAIFNVKEELIPSSFIILPFKLQSAENCSRALLSDSDPSLAMQYANFLWTSTSCESLLTTFKWKNKQKKDSTSETVSESCENANEIAVISNVYRNKVGYLYFLDEETGIPVTKIVDGANVEYPILINNPIPIVKKVLPLMRKGMALMRRSSIVVVFAQIISKDSIKKYPHSWIGAAQSIAQLLYAKPVEDISSTRSITSLSQKADEVRDKFLHFVSTTSETSNYDGIDNNYELDWTEELSILKQLMEKSNLNISQVQQSLELERIKVKGGGYVWVQSKVQNSLPNKTQDAHAKFELENHVPLNSLQSTNSDETPNQPSLKKRYDVDQRIAAIHEFLDMNDVEDNHMSLNSPQCTNSKSHGRPLSQISPKKRYDVDQRIAAINEFIDINGVEDSGFCGGESHNKIGPETTGASSSSNGRRLRCDKVLSMVPSTSLLCLVERKKIILRMRNAQLANYDITLSTLTSANNYLTMSSIEDAMLKLKYQIDSYEKKITAEDIMCEESEKDLNEKKSTDIVALNRLIAKKKAKIESMKKAVQQQEASLLSERLEI